jgi:hypothetical protein
MPEATVKPIVSKGKWDKTTAKSGFQRFSVQGTAFGMLYLPAETEAKNIEITVTLK